MKNESDLRHLLLAYKLGELSIPEREQLDEKILEDQEFSDQLAEAEYDLLDDYRADQLGFQMRRRVEMAFPGRELEFGLTERAFLRPSESGQWRTRRMPIFSLTAAVLLLVVVGAWLFVAYRRQVRTPVQSMQSPMPKNSAPSVDAPGAPVNQESNREERDIAFLVLDPSTVRGASSVVLALNSSVHLARIQWVVPIGNEVGAFRLVVTRDGVTIITVNQRGNLQKIDGSSVAEFDIPSDLFINDPDGTRFLFLIDREDSSHATVGEYPVTLRQK